MSSIQDKILVDKTYDWIPIVSTVTNLVVLFQKSAYNKSYTFTPDAYRFHIEMKSTAKCILLLIPVIGQIVALALYGYFQAKETVDRRENLLGTLRSFDSQNLALLTEEDRNNPVCALRMLKQGVRSSKGAVRTRDAQGNSFYLGFSPNVALRYLGDQLKNDKKFMAEAIDLEPTAFEHLSSSLSQDRNFVLARLQVHWDLKQYIDQNHPLYTELKDEFETIDRRMQILQSENFSQATMEDWHDPRFMLEVVNNWCGRVRTLPLTFNQKDDYSLVLGIIKEYGFHILHYADKSFSQDLKVIKFAYHERCLWGRDNPNDLWRYTTSEIKESILNDPPTCQSVWK